MQERHEYKHSLNHMDYTVLRSRIAAVLPRDANTGTAGEYVVRSLYFDTPNDKALREKIDGVNEREKFRIRRYNDSCEFLMLEKKAKRRSLCYKRATRLTKYEVQKILDGDIDWMPHRGDELVTELYARMRGQMLRPKTIVQYIREPFICPAGNVRVTFDRDIRTGLYCTDFLRNDYPTVPAGDEIVLLEVKYDAFIPAHIASLLQLGNRRATACSKYAICRIYG